MRPLEKLKKYPVRSAVGLISLIVACIFLYGIGSELFIYATRSETGAKLAATKTFHCISKQQGYRESDFDGPRIVQDWENVYAFEWALHGAKDAKVSIVVAYFPYGIDYSVSEKIPFGKITPTPPCS